MASKSTGAALKAKYALIDKKRISKEAREVLDDIKTVTKDFTDVSPALKNEFNTFYGKLKKAKPESIRGTKEYKEFKKSESPRPEATPKPTSSLKKAIREARKRRQAQGIRSDNYSIERDAGRPALPKGRRKSKDGNIYWEYRENRIDRKPKRYPKLEHGGGVGDYEPKSREMTATILAIQKSRINPADVSPAFAKEMSEDIGHPITMKEAIRISKGFGYEGIYADGGGVDDTRYPRKADDTGKGIFEGWVVGDGEAYYETQEGALKAAKAMGYKSIDEAYEDEAMYYTEWEDSEEEIESQGYYYTADGQEIELNAKGGGVDKISSKSVGVAKMMNIKNWYTKTYPTDELGEEISDEINFWGLWSYMSQGYSPYEVLGVDDSVVRERVFEKLAEILKVDYDVVYNKWQARITHINNKYAEGGGVDYNKKRKIVVKGNPLYLTYSNSYINGYNSDGSVSKEYTFLDEQGMPYTGYGRNMTEALKSIESYQNSLTYAKGGEMGQRDIFANSMNEEHRADKMSRGGRTYVNAAGKESKEEGGSFNLYEDFYNNKSYKDFIADVNDYFKSLSKDKGADYSDMIRKDLINVLSTGQLTFSDGAYLKFKKGGGVKSNDELSYDEWEKKYKPIKNPNDDGGAFGGKMFETYGDDFNYVKEINEKSKGKRVWTYVAEGDHESIQAGMKYVNRLGYFVTEKAWKSEDEFVTFPQMDDDDTHFAKGGKVDWDFIEANLPDYSTNQNVADSDDLQRFIDDELSDEQKEEYIYEKYGRISKEKAKEIMDEINEYLMDKAMRASGKMASGGIFGDSRYNTGRSWTLDRKYHNKSEDYEKPMKSRKKKYAIGGFLAGAAVGAGATYLLTSPEKIKSDEKPKSKAVDKKILSDKDEELLTMLYAINKDGYDYAMREREYKSLKDPLFNRYKSTYEKSVIALEKYIDTKNPFDTDTELDTKDILDKEGVEYGFLSGEYSNMKGVKDAKFQELLKKAKTADKSLQKHIFKKYNIKSLDQQDIDNRIKEVEEGGEKL